MSQHPPDIPPEGLPPQEPAKAPPPVDEVADAKARLLTSSASGEADPTRRINDFLRDHPYVAAGAALGAGLVVARVQVLRKLVTVGGMWAAKRYLTRYLRQMGR